MFIRAITRKRLLPEVRHAKVETGHPEAADRSIIACLHRWGGGRRSCRLR